MLKRIIFLFFILFLNNQIKSQVQAVESRIDVQKTQQPVAKINIPSSTDVTEESIKEYMGKRGVKSSSYKEFFVFRSCKLDSNTEELNDLYFKVEKKSSQEKDISTVTLLPTKKGEDIPSHSPTDNSKIEPAKSFLNNMAPFVEAHYINLQVTNQEKVLQKAQKKMTSLESDSSDLEKKIRDINADLEQNKNDQAKENIDIQTKATSDFDTKQKAQKKMNKLIDTQSDLQKKLRKTQEELIQNKKELLAQQKEVDKELQILSAIKSKQTN
ncbi:MAG: hypothetical protein ACHQET_11480 [Chitinophagales bacterium]